MLICLICIEIALALFFAVGAVRAYAHVMPVGPAPTSCGASSTTPMPSTNKWKDWTTSLPTTITTKGWATWYSTNSVVADYKVRGQAIPTNGIFPMANGKPLDDNAMTCAMWIVGKNGSPRFPDGRIVVIRNAKNGKTVTVAWTDNGPGSVPRSKGVICDLTPAAMRALSGEEGIKAGRVEVTVEELK